MYRVLSNISIVQKPSKDFPTRTKTLLFDFVHEFECSDGWRDLTNDGKVVIPKNLYYGDANNKLVPLYGTNVNIGGFSLSAPLLLRGDAVTISSGYKYFKAGKEITETTVKLNGYISKVTSKKPIEFLVEDNMWKLKQIPVAVHTFSKTDTLEDILRYLLKGTPFTVNALTKTTFGAFTVGNETVAEVLARLRKMYHFESYFRGNELRSGGKVYIESEAVEQTFMFQNNIISDNLEYRRKDDIVLSAVVSNTIEEETGKHTRDGQAKTKRVRLEVLITLQNGSDKVVQYVKKKNEPYPPNTGGERRTLFYPGAFTIAELVKSGTDELKKYYYTGFKGKFTTFGIPFVKMGDNARLIDKILPERNGTYKIKSVSYTGGVGGLRQEVELDYLIRINQP